MKYFTKILSIILCVAEVSVLAQAPPMPSDKCKKVLEKFENNSAGKTFQKCSSLLDEGKIDDVCSNSECVSISLPSEIKTDCKSGDDIFFSKALEEALKAYGETIKQICKNPGKLPTKPDSGNSNSGNSNSGSTTGNGNANGGAATNNGNASGNTDGGAATGNGNVSGNANSGAATTGNSNTGGNSAGNTTTTGGNANGTSAGNTATTGGNANGAAAGNTATTTDPQLSQVPITNANSTATSDTTSNNNNTLDIDSSAGSKFTYSVVAAAALAALNLLL